MPTPPNATATVPVTAVRLDATLKARIAAAQGDLAREMPGLSPTFSDALRVLINEALDARAARAARAAAVPAPTGRGAGGITLHRATNGASVATTVANDP